MSAPTPDAIELSCLRLLEARRDLVQLPVQTIISAIDGAARRLLEPGEPQRTAVLDSLLQVSGFSAPMAAHMLDRACVDWQAPALWRLVNAEFGDAAVLDGFAATGRRRARVRALAPPLGLHVFSGNVPGVAVTSIIRALLVRSAVLGKPAAGEPALASAFAALLREENPVVGNAVDIVYWTGGDPDLENAALRHVSLVVHYGSADAITDLRARTHARVAFVEHGPRLSFAIVDGRIVRNPDALRTLAADMARAVALFDQQGCVSPQLVWVIGTLDAARAFAAATAAALEDIERTLPRGRLSAGEAGAIRELRTRAEFASPDQNVWGPDGLAFSVILSHVPEFEGSCLNRTLLVKHAPALDDVLRAAASLGPLLQTVGIAGFDDGRRLPLADDLARAGATRITSIADMPWPPPEWHHDGRGPLRELVRWVDYEG